MNIKTWALPYSTIDGYKETGSSQPYSSPLAEWRGIYVCVPCLASDKNLAGVHDAAGEAGSVDGAQGRAELDNVSPDQRLGEQTCMLPWWGRLMLSCTDALYHTYAACKSPH